MGAQRIDGFEGPIRVDISNVPKGYAISSPLIIEPEHFDATGTVYAAPDAKPMLPSDPPIKVTATGVVDGKTVTRNLPDLPRLMMGGAPADGG